MTATDARARKLADRIRVIVAEMLETRVKDPRLGFVTVTDARITGDLHDATIFYTVYGDDPARADPALALESAKGCCAPRWGRQTGVRFTPTLTFVADALPDNARHIETCSSGPRRPTPTCSARPSARSRGETRSLSRPREDPEPEHTP